MLDVTTASTDTQLTTTAAVKLVLNTTATADDGLLDALITRASAWAERVVGYALSPQKYRETVAGYGTRRLMLSRTPVRALPGVWDATDTGTATTILSTEYRVDRDAGFLDRGAGWAWDTPSIPSPFAVSLSATPWPGEEDSPWLVDYVAGYTRDGLTTASAVWSTVAGTTSTARTLPQDIEEAVIKKVIAWYEKSEGVLAKSVGDLRLEFDPVGEDPAFTLLSAYRRSA